MQAPRSPGYFSPAPLPPVAERLRFVKDAEKFAAEYGDSFFAFFLRAHTKADRESLNTLLCKIYAESLPENYGRREGLAEACARFLFLPLAHLFGKKWRGTRAEPVEWTLEMPDISYFLRRYELMFQHLPGKKRVSTSMPSGFDRIAVPVIGPHQNCSSILNIIWLTAALLAIPQLLWTSLRLRLNVLATYRRALSIYSVHESFFARYPTRNFITCFDEQNHPSRYLAFKRHCKGALVAVQNGDRTRHPSIAFGMLDSYYVFGEYMRRVNQDVGSKVRRYVLAGALNLDERRDLIEDERKLGKPPAYDVLCLDQQMWPFNGFDVRTGKSCERMMVLLSELKRRRPDYRIAYQLRGYSTGSASHKSTLGAIRRLLHPDIIVLENKGQGESYRSILRSRLTMAFNSTLATEAFVFAPEKKVLFINLSDNQYEICCEDPRFQIFDPSANADNFVAHVDYLLALSVAETPGFVRERHAVADGLVQDRIAESLIKENHK